MFSILVDKVTSEQPLNSTVSLQSDKYVTDKTKLGKEGENSVNNLNLTFSGKCIVTLNTVESKDALALHSRNFYFLQRLGFLVG